MSATKHPPVHYFAKLEDLDASLRNPKLTALLDQGYRMSGMPYVQVDDAGGLAIVLEWDQAREGAKRLEARLDAVITRLDARLEVITEAIQDDAGIDKLDAVIGIIEDSGLGLEDKVEAVIRAVGRATTVKIAPPAWRQFAVVILAAAFVGLMFGAGLAVHFGG